LTLPIASVPAGRRARRRTPMGGGGPFAALCILPALVLYVLFLVYPTLNVFHMSLFDWNGLGNAPSFIGLDNFAALIHDPAFVRAFENTLFILVVVKIVTICSSIFIAAVLTRETLVGAGWYRFVLYLPSVLSIVVVAAIFSAVFDQNNGLVNGLLQALGLGHGPVWLGDQNVVMYSVAIAMVWQSLGYYVVLYMAGMSSVPVEIYESASLDGAGRMTQLGSITIPLIWSNIRTTLTFFVLSSVNLAFVLVKALTDGGPNGSLEVLLNYMYKQAFTNSAYGYGMAIGVVTFLFSFLVAMLISHVTRREVLQY